MLLEPLWTGMGGGRILDSLALWIEDTMHHLSICSGMDRAGAACVGRRGTSQGTHCPVFEASMVWTLSQILTSELTASVPSDFGGETQDRLTP